MAGDEEIEQVCLNCVAEDKAGLAWIHKAYLIPNITGQYPQITPENLLGHLKASNLGESQLFLMN